MSIEGSEIKGRKKLELTFSFLHDMLHLPDHIEIEAARFDVDKRCIVLVISSNRFEKKISPSMNPIQLERVLPDYMWEGLS